MALKYREFESIHKMRFLQRSLMGVSMQNGGPLHRLAWRNYCNQNLSKPDSRKLCTYSQSAETHRLAPSTFSEAIGFWPRRRVQLWLEKIGAIETFPHSADGILSTLWSSMQEKEALEFYKRLTRNTVLLSSEFQANGNADKNPLDDWLGASPDGIVYELPSHSRGLVQIKCPYFFKADMANASPWWRIPLHCVPQAQGLMEILDRDWMHFYVWTPEGSSLFTMKRDAEYWNVLKMALSDFWCKHVQPAKELCAAKSVIKKPLTESRSFRPAARHELYHDIVIYSKRIVDSSKLLMREIEGKLRR